jgi:DNA-binding CsgD family transcriptional regulator/tetratricopeptide (TPR) repeat protein
VLVAGEAGVGKSRLITEFSAGARAGGARVLSGGCVELSFALPYGPFVEAIRGLADEGQDAGVRPILDWGRRQLGGLLPGVAPDEELPAGKLATIGPPPEPRLFPLMLELLSRLASTAPLVLVLEDLHWVDSTSLDLITYLVHKLRHEPVLVVGTYRDEADSRSDKYDRRFIELANIAEEIKLEPLGFSEISMITRSLLGRSPSERIARRVYELSDGNPFYAEEIVTSRAAEGLPLPHKLVLDPLARVAALSQDAQDTVRRAAVVGRDFSFRLLTAVSDLPAQPLGAGLTEALASGIFVSGARDGYRFRHEIIRVAVYDALPRHVRMEMHRSVASALAPEASQIGREGAFGAADAARRWGELAHHWHEAGDTEPAVAAAVQAARAATRLNAYAEAWRHYELAIQLWPHVADAGSIVAVTRRDIWLQAAQAAWWAGEPDQSISLLEELLAAADPGREPTTRAELLERLGFYYWELGKSDESERTESEACGLLADQPSSALKARAYAAHGATMALRGRYEKSLQLCRSAIDLAREVGARHEEAYALNYYGISLALTGSVQAGEQSLREAGRLAAELEDTEAHRRATSNLAFILLETGQLEQALQVSQEGAAFMRRYGLDNTIGASHYVHIVDTMLRLGRWADAAEIGHGVLSRTDLGGVPAAFLRLHLARHAAATGDHHAGLALLHTADEAFTGIKDAQYLGIRAAARAELALLTDDFDTALAEIKDGLTELEESQDYQLVVQLCWLGSRVVAEESARAALLHGEVTAGHLADAQRFLELAQSKSGSPGDPAGGLPEMALFLSLCEAEFKRLTGEVDALSWEIAVKRADDLGEPYPATYARFRLAEVLLADWAPAGPGVLRHAYDTASALGSNLLREELKTLAAQHEIKLIRSGSPVEPPKPSLAKQLGLTPREGEVLQALVRDLSNKAIAQELFISESTASVHVTHILEKLGVKNRREAAALARRVRFANPYQGEHRMD